MPTNTGTEKRQNSNEARVKHTSAHPNKCPMCDKPVAGRRKPCSQKCEEKFQRGENERAERRMAQMTKDTPEALKSPPRGAERANSGIRGGSG